VNAPLLRIDVVTLFPEMFRGALDASILARAAAQGLVEIRLHALREHGIGAHRQVDDAPFGGGGGMVLRPEPVFAAVEAATGRPAGECPGDEAIVLLSPAGRRFDQSAARRLASLRRVVLVCGRYEGVDDRVRTRLCTEALSLGDFVLSGGEPAALAITDALVRLVPGALGNDESASTESFEDGLLEAPHYTRPASFRGWDVPSELLSGHHAEIARWRRRQSVLLTARTRPDLLESARESGLLAKDDVRALREDGRDDETRIPAEASASSPRGMKP
jgi:tRNA (guanine37-N1)-methyltransferase